MSVSFEIENVSSECRERSQWIGDNPRSVKSLSAFSHRVALSIAEFIRMNAIMVFTESAKGEKGNCTCSIAAGLQDGGILFRNRYPDVSVCKYCAWIHLVGLGGRVD
jgi:hypothetical protein